MTHAATYSAAPLSVPHTISRCTLTRGRRDDALAPTVSATMLTLLCTVRLRSPLTVHDTVTPLDVSDTPNLDDCPQERGRLAARSNALRAADIHRKGQVLPNIVHAAERSGVVHLDTPPVRKASASARSIRSSLPIGTEEPEFPSRLNCSVEASRHYPQI